MVVVTTNKQFSYTVCHIIWMWHNKEAHDGSFNRPSCMISHINNLVQEYEHAKTAINISLMPHRILSFIKWEALPVGWVKLNADGARDNHGNTNSGGIIRGSDRE